MAEKPEAEVVEASAETTGGKKKMLVIILIAVLVSVGIAGGAAWFFMGKSHDDQEQADEGEHAAKADEHGKDAKKHKKPAAPAIYFKMDPALVVNFQSNGVTRFLQVAIEISTRDPQTAEALKLHDPVIRNDLLMLLGSQQEDTISSREAKDALRVKALEAVRNVITNEGGEGEKVENVFFTSFVMQ